jgi:hypothetical protein
MKICRVWIGPSPAREITGMARKKQSGTEKSHLGNGANRTSGQIPQARADDRSTTETNSQPTLNQFRFMEQQGDGNGDERTETGTQLVLTGTETGTCRVPGTPYLTPKN